MPKAERKAQMLVVAEQVFAERGYLAASMDEIAERVGVSKPMLYEYFGSKEGLLIGCIHRARAELRARTEESILGAEGPEEVLRRGLVAFFRFIAEHDAAWELLRQEATITVPSAVEEIEGVRQQQTDLVASALAGYAPSTTGLVAQAWAEMIVGACERLALWGRRRGDVSPERATALVLDLVWPGLSARITP
jgi:AcrR family transcriptional regulator